MVGEDRSAFLSLTAEIEAKPLGWTSGLHKLLPQPSLPFFLIQSSHCSWGAWPAIPHAWLVSCLCPAVPPCKGHFTPLCRPSSCPLLSDLHSATSSVILTSSVPYFLNGLKSILYSWAVCLSSHKARSLGIKILFCIE